MAMLGNLAMLENVVIALGGKMSIIETFFLLILDSLHSFGPIGQYTSRIHNKFIV